VQHLKIIKGFSSPADAQLNCLKNSFRICIKIDIKTAPTCFGAVTPSPGSALLVLAIGSTSNALPDDGVTDCTETCRSCFNINFNANSKIVVKTIHLCINW
jgi:hypothetical protein